MDIFTAFGLSASAGLNAYIPLLIVALLARFTPIIQLNSPWDGLESWWTIGILLVLATVEFFADKVPAVNHVNDVIQTFIRPTAGAVLFAASTSVVSDLNPVLAVILGLLVAGCVHAVKAGALRPAVTATTGGAGNIPVSIAEDIISTLLSVIAAVMPVIIAVVLVLLTALIVWWTWRRINSSRVKTP
jgi:hypothetical protein